jgi:hypothetical protein
MSGLPSSLYAWVKPDRPDRRIAKPGRTPYQATARGHTRPKSTRPRLVNTSRLTISHKTKSLGLIDGVYIPSSSFTSRRNQSVIRTNRRLGLRYVPPATARGQLVVRHSVPLLDVEDTLVTFIAAPKVPSNHLPQSKA